MQTKKISVTTEHIQKGYRGNAYHCPVARALETAGLINPSASPFSLQFHAPEDRIWRSVPPSSTVRDFIARFDSNLEVSPFEFEIQY